LYTNFRMTQQTLTFFWQKHVGMLQLYPAVAIFFFFLVIACTIGGKRYSNGEIFIARNCEKMCQCRRTRMTQIITCMPLCPRMRPMTCRKGLVKATARYVYTFRPLCYCPTNFCVRKRPIVP